MVEAVLTQHSLVGKRFHVVLAEAIATTSRLIYIPLLCNTQIVGGDMPHLEMPNPSA